MWGASSTLHYNVERDLWQGNFEDRFRRASGASESDISGTQTDIDTEAVEIMCCYHSQPSSSLETALVFCDSYSVLMIAPRGSKEGGTGRIMKDCHPSLTCDTGFAIYENPFVCDAFSSPMKLLKSTSSKPAYDRLHYEYDLPLLVDR